MAREGMPEDEQWKLGSPGEWAGGAALQERERIGIVGEKRRRCHDH